MGNIGIRAATLADAAELLRIRFEAIVAVRFAGMAEAQIRDWAEHRDMHWMVRALRERETWVGTVDDRIVSWIALENDRVEGLYTDPLSAGRGIGSALLLFVERGLRSRGVEHIGLEASANAVGFYRKRGYVMVGPGSTDDAHEMRKVLAPVGDRRRPV